MPADSRFISGISLKPQLIMRLPKIKRSKLGVAVSVSCSRDMISYEVNKQLMINGQMTSVCGSNKKNLQSFEGM